MVGLGAICGFHGSGTREGVVEIVGSGAGWGARSLGETAVNTTPLFSKAYCAELHLTYPVS